MTAKPKIKLLFFLLAILVFQSCATRHSQFGSKKPSIIKDDFDKTNKISHTFYLIGDAGNADQDKSKNLLSILKERLVKADSSSTLIFLGDNIYPAGMPSKGSSNRTLAEEKMNNQLALSKDFKGRTVFIPGNHDWINGVEGLKEEAKYVKDYFKNETAFLPRKSCGIDQININENVALIVIDSEWYLQDWDKNPTINEDCDIKTREQFFDELEYQINNNQKKTTIIAMHHPLMSSGAHGGQFSVEQQIFPFETKIPLPVFGSVINILRKTSGINPQDLHNKKYNAFVKRVKTLIQDKSNVIVVSGHDHSLQYIDHENIKQVISGAGSKTEAARAIHDNDFSFGHNGYAVLQVLKSGASKISFYGIDYKGNEALLFKTQPLMAMPKPNLREFPKNFPTTKDTSVYTKAMTKKGSVYRFLWGKHFRKYYSLPIHAKAVSLDTLYGGLKPTIAGDGHQLVTLRLEDKNGREYVMRSLKKSATKFLQSVAFKDQPVEKDFKDTYTEGFLLDFYTTSHPYTPFVVGKLADRLGINHTNPVLYYVPKQNPLGLFNENFGNELYMIEERPTDSWKDLRSFGKPSKVLSTEDVLANIHADAKYEVDQRAYIRARMFDILIGDWDRNKDQWRWGEYNENGKVIYRPIPRDRDQAFTKYDGTLLSILMNIPALRNMRKFNQDLKNVKWFNREGYNLDLALLPKAEEKDWIREAKYIADNLSDRDIEKAFDYLPKEVKDETIDTIKSQLKIRKTHLEKYARQYYKVLEKTVLIVGTEKKDKFVITRIGKFTKVQVYNINDNSERLTFDRTFKAPETKQLWIYGLNDEDVFEVKGRGRNKIQVRLLGGNDKDTYVVATGGKVAIYDFKTNNDVKNASRARTVLSNNYAINTYDYEKPKYNVFAGYPLIGFNPDDGVKMGAVVNYTVNGFNRNPYSQRHSIKANYYFATNGFELSYKGIFPHFIGQWNLILDALYTSPNFSINYFGLGNDTPNYDNDFGKDFNRVKTRTIRVTPAFQWVGQMGSSFTVKPTFERLKIDETPNRFISNPGVVNHDVFNYKNFADLNAEYVFENYDNASNPTLGILFSLLGGFKMNIDETKRRYPYAESSLGFNYRISKDGKVVLATVLKGKALFDNQFEFYQAATVGGDFDLRGFRNQRFSGKQSFYQSTDLRWNLGKLQNGFAPLSYGVFGGFDYGRVWLKNNPSDKWHQSVGAGVWINGINLLTAKMSYFYSTDGGRLSAGLGFGF